VHQELRHEVWSGDVGTGLIVTTARKQTGPAAGLGGFRTFLEEPQGRLMRVSKSSLRGRIAVTLGRRTREGPMRAWLSTVGIVGLLAASGGAPAAAFALVAVASPPPAEAQVDPKNLVGLRLHAEIGNTADRRVSGPVNYVVDTNIESVDRDAISYTLTTTVTRVGGAAALRMVTRVKVPFAQVTIFRHVGQPMVIGFQCTDGSKCIPWSVTSYVNDDPNAAAPTGGMEEQSTVAMSDASAYDEFYTALCRLATCRS
jgi:hypothetical protein